MNLESIEKATIPHDLEAEQAILGTVMIYNESFTVINSIIKDACYFYTPAHQHMFRAISELSGNGHEINSITLGDELKSLNQLEEVGGYPYLSIIEDCHLDPSHVARVCKIMAEKYFLRLVISLTSDISRRSRDPEFKSKDLIDEAIEKLTDIRKMLSMNAKAVSVYDSLPEIINNIEMVKDGKMEVGMISGYNDFDRMLGGGAQLGDLIFIGAQPSVGKTSLAVCLSYALVYKSRKGLIFSMESSRNSIIRDRLLPAAMSVNSHSLRAGNIEQKDWEFLHDLKSNSFMKNLKICDESTMNINDIYSLASMEHKTNGLDFIMIDYVQLISATNDKENRNTNLGTIARGLKRINKDFNIPIVCLSQLNENDKLRDSGELKQVADVEIILSKTEEEANIIDCNFRKNRNGIVGHIQLEFIPEYTRFQPVR